ncbi:MAG TPA: hypothetical protein VIJ16_00415 [Gemmatimonadaceae bacterium]
MTHCDPIARSVESTRTSPLSAARIRRRALMAALSLGVVATACSATTSPGSVLPSVGSFTLRAVNDSSVPHQLGTSVVVSGALTIKANLTYSLSEVDSAAGGTTTFTSSGTWSAQNNAIVFMDSNGSLYLASPSATSDTVNVVLATHVNNYVR